MLRYLTLLTAALLLALTASGNEPPTAPAVAAPATDTDPNYRLSTGDTIRITVYNEPDLTVTQTIARSGEVRLPLIGEIILTDQSVREAERTLEKTYRDREFLRKPVVNLVVTTYFPREVSVLGAVRTPGTVIFPRDVTSLDIVEVITRVGGFLPISKANAVTLTRRTPSSPGFFPAWISTPAKSPLVRPAGRTGSCSLRPSACRTRRRAAP